MPPSTLLDAIEFRMLPHSFDPTGPLAVPVIPAVALQVARDALRPALPELPAATLLSACVARRCSMVCAALVVRLEVLDYFTQVRATFLKREAQPQGDQECFSNALAECDYGIVKGECLLQSPDDLEQAAKMVEQSVRIYNHERSHAALKYRTPDAMHRAF